MRSRGVALVLGGLASGCSLLGGVTGDYSLASGGGGVGGTGTGTGTGSGGGPNSLALLVSSEQDAVITDVISANSQLFVSGWFRGSNFTAGGMTVPSPSSTSDDPNAFVFHVDTSGQVDRIAVFGQEGTDEIFAMTPLPGNDELVVVGTCCGLGTFVSGGPPCDAGEPRACIATLARSDFLVLDAAQIGSPDSRAQDVVVRDPDGEPELLVVGEMRLNLNNELENCDIGPMPSGNSSSDALGVLSIDPATLACDSGIYRWADSDRVNGLAIDAQTSDVMLTGRTRGTATLQINNLLDVAFLIRIQDNALNPADWNWWTGDGIDVGHDAIAIGENEFIVVGSITENGNFDLGDPLDPVPPSLGSAIVSRVGANTQPIWATQLSTNVGSDASATAVVKYGATLLVVGTFKGEMRAFSDTIRLDAVGEQDIFLAGLSESNGGVNGALGFGFPGATVEATHIQILESRPVVAGHTDSSIETPTTTLTCPSGASGCAFLVHIEDSP